jgi:hypothetical protein
MQDLRIELNSLGVKVSKAGGGCCGSSRTTTAYSLPMRLDIDIVPFLTEFGTPSPSFETTGLLKIDKQHFLISGVKKISQVRFTAKDEEGREVIKVFEERLIQYIKWYNLK